MSLMKNVMQDKRVTNRDTFLITMKTWKEDRTQKAMPCNLREGNKGRGAHISDHDGLNNHY